MEKSISMPVNLDGQVVLTLFISGMVAIGLLCLAFRYSHDDFGEAPDISFKPGTHYVDEPIRFSAVTRSLAAKDIVWVFDDDTKQPESGPVVFHPFPTPGLKRVRLVIGGWLSKDTLIHIIEHPSTKSHQLPPPTLTAVFSAPSTATVDSLVVFEDRTPGALKWEWTFGEPGSVDATVRNPEYTFRTPGRKKISVVVNGNIRGESMIVVLPKAVLIHKPNPPHSMGKIVAGTRPTVDPVTPPPVVVQTISEPMLAEMFRKVVVGELHANDFADYFCHSDPVTLYNGKKMPFTALCSKLRDIRKLKKIKKMIVTRQTDPATNCINLITVDLDEKWIHKVLPYIIN